MCVDCADDTCIVILEYTPEARVLPRQENTGIYKQNEIQIQDKSGLSRTH